ncbi:MAG: ABC transporter ATP-binding protein [Chitinispirillaceae bacterium]
MSSKLELKNVSFSYGQYSVLKRVTLTAMPGEVVIIGGRSGQGKSTLLEICAGLLEPESGSVLWDEQDISSLSKYDMYDKRKRMGYVFQVHALISNHTVFDNIALPLRSSSKLTDSEIKRKVRAQMETLGITGIGKAFPEVLSAAQLKTVAVARALINKPKLLLLDEPLSGVDPFTAQSIIDVLHDKWEKERMTIVMISHSLNAWPEWRAKRLMLKNGALESAADHFKVVRDFELSSKDTKLWNKRIEL